jgi:septal ring factor EnvC (AmiA/AmiB activator)
MLVTTQVVANTAKEIINTKTQVKERAKAYKNIYSKVSELSNNINKEKKRLKNLNSDIKILEHKLKKSSAQLDEKKSSLKETKDLQKAVLDKKQKLEIELVNYLSKDLSLSLIIKKLGNQNLNEIIQNEVYKKYSIIVKKELKTLVSNIDENDKLLKKVEQKVEDLTKFIETNKKELEDLKKLQSKREKTIADYVKQKDEYSKQLDDITAQKKKLSTILKSLQIMKNKEDEKARREEQDRIRQAKLAKQREKEQIKRNKEIKENDEQDVRILGSSYQKARVMKYRGKKYNSPIKYYKIVKKFGTYVDPVYKIKIFNDAIILKSTKKNQKVRAVETGKVIFAKKMPTLGNVVIIKHKNGIHTTYAKLDSIASVIKNGKWIKSGYVIGRVSDELSFQAIKNDRYINPSRFLRLK